MIEALKHRFGAHRVDSVTTMEGDLDLVILDLEVRSPVKVLITNGFRDYKMLIPEAVNEPNRVELFF